jgi:predicted dehydrogenase
VVQRIGLVGSGYIADIYLRNAALFRDIRFTACADMRPEAAEARATQYGLAALSAQELYDSDEVDIVLNLTNPEAHAAVSLAALSSGKHVYTEKPLATTLEDGQAIVAAAANAGLRVGSAPDTVLGVGLQTARQLVDDGSLGLPISGVATVMSRGMEHWHPAPAYYFQPGGGPVLDMGPYYIGALTALLGPIEAVTASGRVGLPERVVTAAGPNLGQRIRPQVPTTVHAILRFQSGAQITLLASWDVWKHGQTPIEIHGEQASIRVPDPNFFAGTVEVATERELWRARETPPHPLTQPNFPLEKPIHANYRGLGLAEMAQAIEAGRAPRVGGEWAFHILDVMMAILRSVDEERTVEVASRCERPAAFPPEESRTLLAEGSS